MREGLWLSVRTMAGRSPALIGGGAPRHHDGMILGVARISGESAPLLFTSLNNTILSTAFRTNGGPCPR